MDVGVMHSFLRPALRCRSGLAERPTVCSGRARRLVASFTVIGAKPLWDFHLNWFASGEIETISLVGPNASPPTSRRRHGQAAAPKPRREALKPAFIPP
jgi:hypothetical protein